MDAVRRGASLAAFENEVPSRELANIIRKFGKREECARRVRDFQSLVTRTPGVHPARHCSMLSQNKDTRSLSSPIICKKSV